MISVLFVFPEYSETKKEGKLPNEGALSSVSCGLIMKILR